MNIRCVIVDDEQNNIDNLQYIIAGHFPWLQVAATATTVAHAQEAITQYQPHLLLLDIQMHGETGFDLLKQMPDLPFEIIFITAYDQFGIQAIKFSALDYLLKPVRIEELRIALNKARERISSKQKDNNLDNLLQYLHTSRKEQQKIALPMQQEIRYVPVGSIIRCEASDNYTKVLMTDGETLLVSKTLKEFALLLKSHAFVRTHQSHLVNLHVVKSFLKEDGGQLMLQNGQKIPISRAYREQVKQVLQQHLG
ncbi:MAG: LytTR family DNA-binding domain-containing protein [Chitinophagaceae bacterium]